MRLTYELGHNGSKQYDTDNKNDMPINNIWKAINKLGQLEDIEEELGIDLLTLFKVISQGYIFVEEQNTEEKEIVAEYIEPNFLNHTFDFKEPRKEIGKGRPFSRIGITWALTKEELENDK